MSVTATTTNLAEAAASLSLEIAQITAYTATATATTGVGAVTRELSYAYASLALISGEEALATATASSVLASASSVVSSASSQLRAISSEDNLYGFIPSFGGNLAMTVIMGVFFLAHSGLGLFYKTWWFGISYMAGTLLEVLGYIGRVLAHHTPNDSNQYLLQIVCLTIAPCFIMSGIYFLLAQLIQVYGTQYPMLKPMRYSQIFITSDVISLVIQGGGGGWASALSKQNKNADNGTHMMVAGLVFQVVSMSCFMYLYIHFLWKIRYLRPSQSEIEHTFNPRYSHLRSRTAFKFFPLVVLASTIFVYVRSVYRCAELGEGWEGYLIQHEIYFMILDAAMMGLAILLFLPFHPAFVLGKGAIPVKGTKAYRKMMESEGGAYGPEQEKSNSRSREVSVSSAGNV